MGRSDSLGVLALNLGSASLKAASFWLPADAEDRRAEPVEKARTSVEGGRPGDAMANADGLLADVVRQLAEPNPAPDIIAHRIVHGADRTGPADLTPATLLELHALSPWAPLHQPPALALAEAAMRRWPNARQVGVFDTSWHQSMPEQHRMFPIPHALYSQGVKRYGFHGLAFRSAMRQLGRISPGVATKRVVLAHLGGGSSICAVRHGRCVNTTMGMTPLGGVPMAYRSGSLDPGVLLHLQRGLGMTPDEIDKLLWTQSGLQGLSGESGDMRVLLASPSEGARRAIDVYVTQVVQGIAAMAACVGGIDGLVFSGGIGSHASYIRDQVTRQLAWLGLRPEEESRPSEALDAFAPQARAQSFALIVDEEFEIARSVFPEVRADEQPPTDS